MSADSALSSLRLAHREPRRRYASLSASDGVAYAQSMPASLQDSSLMLRYSDGDQAAFETLYRRHNDALYRYLLRLCGNRATAEDLYQEVWSRIIKARDRYRPTAKFRTYLFRIAHNCFIDSTRRNRRYATGEVYDAEQLVDLGPSPEDAAERAGLRRRLLVAVAELPLEQRDAFLLHQEAGLTVEEIALTTGVNRETAKSRLRYANTKLKAALAESHGEPADFGDPLHSEREAARHD